MTQAYKRDGERPLWKSRRGWQDKGTRHDNANWSHAV